MPQMSSKIDGDSSMVVKPDEVLAQAGDWGRYQAMLMVTFSAVNILAAFHYFGQTFVSVEQPKWCENETENVVNFTSCEFDGLFGYKGLSQLESWAGDGWIAALGQSLFFAGSVIGSIFIGVLADRAGRRHALILALMLAAVGNAISAAASGPIIYTIGRLIGGFAADSNFVMLYILVIEYVRPSARTLALHICIGVWYGAACAALPWIAAAAGSWRCLLILVAAPHLAAPILYLFVPESAHWLLAGGRVHDAMKCYQKVADVNHRRLSSSALVGLQGYADKYIRSDVPPAKLFDLFKTPKLRRKMSILIFKSMVMTLCYDAISRDINSVNSSPFIVFSVTSLAIPIACVLVVALQDRVGRKALASGSLAMTGICMLGVAISVSVPEVVPWLAITLLSIARLTITVAYNSGAQYAVELVPGAARGAGVSLVHLVGYAASAGSAPLLRVGRIWPPAPGLTLAFAAIAAAAACLWLPETLSRPLPITLEDGEVFGDGDKPCDFPCCFVPRTCSQQPLRG